jgi:hypothetical protein
VKFQAADDAQFGVSVTTGCVTTLTTFLNIMSFEYYGRKLMPFITYAYQIYAFQ